MTCKIMLLFSSHFCKTMNIFMMMPRWDTDARLSKRPRMRMKDSTIRSSNVLKGHFWQSMTRGRIILDVSFLPFLILTQCIHEISLSLKSFLIWKQIHKKCVFSMILAYTIYTYTHTRKRKKRHFIDK